MLINSFNTVFYNKFDIKWYFLNCKNKKIGRLSTVIINILKGKYDIKYTPNFINNNKIILYNIDKINLLNRKKKKFIYYTGYPGGQKIKSYINLYKKNPKKIFLHSLLGMMKKSIFIKNNFKKNIFFYTNKEKKYIQKKNFIYININE